LMVIRGFDESPIVYSGEPENVAEWLKAKQMPSIFEMKEENIDMIFVKHTPIVILFIQGEADPTFVQAAKEMQGEILFAY